MTKDAILNASAHKALQELYSDGTLRLARDKVAEAYLGQWGTTETIEKTRARVHWITSQVKGERVLDLGTSEGITAILLAREGFHVTGIDINSDAIAYAQTLLEKEDKITQSRVRFNCKNIYEIEKLKSFDTIIVGEVIEHICNIENFISKILEKFASSSSRIVFTTPFGVFPDKDHKHSIFISDMWKYLSPYGEFSHISTKDGYIRATIDLHRLTNAQRSPQFDAATAERLLIVSEEASYQAQVTLFRLIDKTRRSLTTEIGRSTSKDEEVLVAKNELAEARASIASYQNNNQKLRSEIDALKEENDRKSIEISTMKTKFNSDISSLNEKITKLNAILLQKNDEIEQTQEELKVIKIERTDLAEKLTKAERDATNIRASVEKISYVENDLRHTISERDRTIAYAEQSIESIQIMISDLFDNVETPRSTLSRFNRIYRDVFELKNRKKYETSFDVRPGKSYRLSLYFNPQFSPAEKNAALVQIRYFSEDGKEIPGPYLNTQMSKAVGAYRYLHPVDNKSYSVDIQITAPLNAVSIKIIAQTWRPSSRLKIYNRVELAETPIAALSPQVHSITRALKRVTNKLGQTPISNRINDSSNLQPEDRGSIQGKSKSLSTNNYKNDFEMSPALFDREMKSQEQVDIPTVPSILDEMSQASWRSEFNLTPIPRHGWRQLIEGIKPDFALLESCWNGNRGDWQYAFTSPNLQHANAVELLELLKYLRQTNTPVAFWNKEDPMHFEKFLPIASKADFIFTTDEARVASYRQAVPSAQVTTLPFAASLDICNPTDRFRKDPETVCFAGAYYPEGHDERLRQMDYVLPAIERFNGTIYDRYSSHPTNRYRFPDRYQPFIRNAVPFDHMAKLYREFRVFLNVNTIIDSPTMMSRRVYELLASGTPVVSSPSEAISQQFDGIVQVGGNERQITDAVEYLLTDESHWNRISHMGVRAVAQAHTYEHRADIISSAISGRQIKINTPLISIVIASCRPKNIERMIKNVEIQNYPRIDVALSLTPDFDESMHALIRNRLERLGNIENIYIHTLGSEVTLGRCLNEAIKSSRGDYIAKMDDDNIYLANYLSDLIIPFSFSNYDVVGKESYYCYLGGINKLIWRYPEKRSSETKFVAGDAMIIKRSVFERTSFPEKRVGEDTKLLKDIALSGGRIYSADHYNFIKYRAADISDHTWRETEENLLRRSVVIASGLDTKLVEL
jgi:spore maturation protein CgeB/SAM-dependent methyltransferase